MCLSALVVLLESFVESLTVVLPFFPHATMERIVKEGQVRRTQLLRHGNCCSKKCIDFEHVSPYPVAGGHSQYHL